MKPFFLATALLAIAVGAEAAPADDGPTAEQFLRLIKSHQDAIKDVAFAFEGEKEVLVAHDGGFDRDLRIQGRYAYRSDGATYLEQYLEYGGDRNDQHLIRAMVGPAAELARVTPAYFEMPDPPVLKSRSGVGAFFNGESPETYVFLWRFNSLKGPTDFGYKFLDWEVVDGHRCAHIEFSPHPNAAGRVLQELWVDLERGGHPLRIRNSVGGQTVYLVDQVRLQEFPLSGGEKAWFPVAGRYDQYYRPDGKGYTDEPTIRTTIYALNGTLFFNQGLGDKVFRVKADRFRPDFAGPRLAAAKKAARQVDFEDAEKKLDALLADPSRSARAPADATLATRAESSLGTFLAWGFGVAGGIAVIAAGLIVWRRQ